MPQKFQTPSGMHDLLGTRAIYFEKIYDTVVKIARFYGFDRIETPLLEDTRVFTRGVGLSTDIVEKEMYNLKTKGGDNLSLRPEGTASVMRSYLEHDMYTKSQPVKLFYFGPFFRYERPQAGRYRQFWQFGLETIGKSGPGLDAQTICAVYAILSDLGVKDVVVEINNMGDAKCRGIFKGALKKYLKKANLCSDCKKRSVKNPLRVLDCKQCVEMKRNAPQIIDYLCKDCREDLKKTLELLEEVGIPYDLNPFLVRGLDYYTGNVYEFFTKGKESLALGGGGRYDGLSELLGGGEDLPATGAAIGVERVMLAMKSAGVEVKREKPQIFIAHLGDLAKKKCLKIFEDFRKAGILAHESIGRDSLKSQLNQANKLSVKWTIIIGREEAIENSVVIRDMNTGSQDKVEIKDLVKEVKQRLKNAK